MYAPNTTGWIDPWGWTGTYIFTDGTTSYIGKGPETRMNTSMGERISGVGNATQSAHMDFGSDKMGLMVEHKLMEDAGAVKNSNYANKINSPGKTLYDAASPEVKAQVDSHAAALDEKFKQSGKSNNSSGGGC